MLDKKNFLFLMTFVLSSCGTNYDVERARSTPSVASEFYKTLQSKYADLAALEKAEADWEDTRKFINRSIDSANGIDFPPEDLRERELPDYIIETVTEARAGLIISLNDKVISEMPITAAIAQVAFDCWLQELEENRQPKDIAACRTTFYEAINILSSSEISQQIDRKEDISNLSVTVQNTFNIFFDFNSASLNIEALEEINRLSEIRNKYDFTEILIIGHTDSSGSGDYNILLSQRRAETVSNALVKKGFSEQIMRVEAYGEERPRTLIPDNTREQDNRRVDIIFND